MTEERFYCERPRCSVHNKKTKALANSLKFFKNAEFGFGEDFTPKCFSTVLKKALQDSTAITKAERLRSR